MLIILLLLCSLAYAEVTIDGELVIEKYTRHDNRSIKVTKPTYSQEKKLIKVGYVDKKTGKRIMVKEVLTAVELKEE